ncbi:MAG: alpha-amylase [Acidobacteria bacterium]|nr:alpha-amylase [Acidobacteriota bacterium]MBI3426198.1 alpha-amylase [Acidobacteriota bacterium]
MSFSADQLQIKRPASIREVELPRRQQFHPSPTDWRNEVLYFLLPDRFSDGQEAGRPLLDRNNIQAARPANFRWDHWAQSGGERWQGGTIAGITSKLGYLQKLGVTALWVGPVFKQRGHLDTYHGYGIQDFLEVDPHFGTRQDLVELVAAAHQRGMRIILDVIFNHSGHNWDYEQNQVDPPYKPWPDHYQKGLWLAADGQRTAAIAGDDAGVWPAELRADDCYTRAGKGSLAGEDIDNDRAEMKRTDFDGAFRDFNFDGSAALTDLARCFKYWIALTDCDGFRLDTLKHVPQAVARNFCGTIKEFAANLGKANFFLVGEVGGPDENAGRYLDVLELNLNATLDIGSLRTTLHQVAKGLAAPQAYFDIVGLWDPVLGSHQRSGPRHVTVLDDHDHVSGDKVRFSSDAASAHQVVAGVAIQLFSLGIPCIYYGTEQAFAGPEKSEREQYLPDYNAGNPPPDKYLREIMFGVEHPRLSGRAGLQPGATGLDPTLPAFGAFGSVGHHCFDPDFPTFARISALIALRQARPVLRYGRQYLRDIANFNQVFRTARAGELIAWSRILDDEEVLCVVNGNGSNFQGADVIVDAQLNAGSLAFMEVIHNSAQTAAGAGYTGSHPVGERLPVKTRDGAAYVEIRGIAPSEVLAITNRP